jgi:hypothetical protein
VTPTPKNGKLATNQLSGMVEKELTCPSLPPPLMHVHYFRNEQAPPVELVPIFYEIVG